jgi:hypothetical protein
MPRLALFFCLLAILPGTVRGETYFVDPDGTGDFPDIQSAIDGVLPGDIIELTDGTFTGIGNRNVTFAGKAVTVRSQSGNPEACAIDCQSAGHGFLFVSEEGPGSILAGLTITNGNGAPGGAIRCWTDACPTISNCVFANNTTSMNGGAVCCIFSAAPTLTGCIFIGNSATFGGGLFCWVGSSPTVTHCTFIDNYAWFGAGIECAGEACPTISHCTFWRNEAERGGAVMSEEGAFPTLTSCTISGNAAVSDGGGIRCENGGYLLVENTIVAFSTNGDAVSCSPSSEVTLRCCDLYGNAGGDWTEPIADQYGVDGNISEDPLFCDSDEGDFRLQEESPCAPFSPPNPECDLIGAGSVGCDPSNVPQPGTATPTLWLRTAVPNPFVVSTRICYGVPATTPEHVQLSIHDLSGRLVRTLQKGFQPNAIWDGRNGKGTPVTSGVYFCNLRVGREKLVNRMILLSRHRD